MKTLKEVIQAAVNRALIECDFNQTVAANTLDITRKTLRKYMDSSLKTKSRTEYAKRKEEVRNGLLEEVGEF